MKKLTINIKGLEVIHWQTFLQKMKLYTEPITGIYDEQTKLATIAFQGLKNLDIDGVVGNDTLSAAAALGFVDVFTMDFPFKPNFSPLVGTGKRQEVFGKFTYEHRPIEGNPENIVITDDWADKNIITVEIPQLLRVKDNAKARFHKLVAHKAVKLFGDWEKAGLIDRVIYWGGSFVPRFIRGGTSLSNHAFGSAFDINIDENGLGDVPAKIGEKGCVRELVQIANENGFYWGGHFTRLDGMHFELAIVSNDTASRGLEDLAVDLEDDGQDLV